MDQQLQQQAARTIYLAKCGIAWGLFGAIMAAVGATAATMNDNWLLWLLNCGMLLLNGACVLVNMKIKRMMTRLYNENENRHRRRFTLRPSK